ncbi:hypothetical protein [Mycolicibacterium farcinogenes]|uniref:Uncharacterized protein n=1 Tax=Mycolicibacterium farcinogenes TaxID=1802 RepID=A0ACD1FMJ3_MYCFR|nr:hypothetical protein [Mycolicibacterium farcinogenes]QZH68318.1 hypothetical protein K6L26_12230 [Mycolicibacterium farcinogenes]
MTEEPDAKIPDPADFSRIRAFTLPPEAETSIWIRDQLAAADEKSKGVAKALTLPMSAAILAVLGVFNLELKIIALRRELRGEEPR